jgi:hypothetical protein
MTRKPKNKHPTSNEERAVKGKKESPKFPGWGVQFLVCAKSTQRKHFESFSPFTLPSAPSFVHHSLSSVAPSPLNKANSSPFNQSSQKPSLRGA